MIKNVECDIQRETSRWHRAGRLRSRNEASKGKNEARHLSVSESSCPEYIVVERDPTSSVVVMNTPSSRPCGLFRYHRVVVNSGSLRLKQHNDFPTKCMCGGGMALRPLTRQCWRRLLPKDDGVTTNKGKGGSGR